MLDKSSALQLVCRKLPPSMTESEFSKIDCVQKFVSEKKAKIRFYPENIIGETAAPPSSTAIISFDDVNDVNIFLLMMSEKVFTTPFGEEKHFSIEVSPIQKKLEERNRQQSRQLPSIDEDPDFQRFVKEYESSLNPADDMMISIDKINENKQTIDNSNLIEMLSSKVGMNNKHKKKNHKKKKNPRHRFCNS